MSDATNDPVDQSNPPISDSANNPPKDEPKNSVAYETHRRLLDEKKKMQAERDMLAAEKKQREEEEARKRGDYEALVKARDEEIKKLTTTVDTFKQRQADAAKLGLFLKSAGSDIEDKWLGLVDLDKIAVNPETGEVDPLSVATAVDTFKKSWPEAFKKAGPKLPTDVPNGSPNTIKESEWKKLPAKEMRKYSFEQIVYGQ